MKQSDLRALLEAHGLSPRQMFGQNFLVDPALLAAIPGDAGVQAGERVLEVGPGAGALTTELLRAGASVLAVEIDVGMFGLLQQQFADEVAEGRLRLLHADVLASEERLHPEVEAWWKEGTAPRVVANLPYGVQKRIEVVRAMVSRPKLLLLDEPAAGLNDVETRQLQELLEKVSDSGVTILVVEHDMHFVRNLCDHVVVLNFGEKIFEGTPDQVHQNPAVLEAYLGRDETQTAKETSDAS